LRSTRRSERDGVGFVLAGGQSRRMGRDKAEVEFCGRPLAAHAVDMLKAAGLDVFIAGAREDAGARLEQYAPVLFDREPGLGPLGGICTALASTTANLAVFVPVDVPLLPASLIVYMLERAQAGDGLVTLACVNGQPETFPAVIARRALPALTQELEARRLGCLASFRRVAAELGETVGTVDTEVLVQSGKVCHPDALPPVRWFLNVNGMGELRRAAALAGSRVI
jgi:molybdopterin-guanine dinucleotide biosynthesis protein A